MSRPRHRYDLRRLRGAVSIGAVLAHYGIDAGLRPSGHELVGCCPLPEHAGDRDNRGAFRVDPRRGLWNCLTHCGGGDAVRLVAWLERGDWAAAARVLAQIETGWPAHHAPPRANNAGFRPYTRSLRLDPDHPFLRERGIEPATARLFEAGWWPLGGMLHGCVAVRLFDPDGHPLGYAGRRTDPDHAARRGKWVFPKALPKRELLFGWHQARPHAAAHGLIVVEGPWDAMRLYQVGFPNVVALCGSTLSPPQRARLGEAPSITLLLDGDAAGRSAAHAIEHTLGLMPVRRIDLDEGRDPASLRDDVLRSILTAL